MTETISADGTPTAVGTYWTTNGDVVFTGGLPKGVGVETEVLVGVE